MKKIIISTMLLLVGFMSAAANDIVSLKFNRTGTDAASVAVSVVDGEGNAIEGASASLTAVSHALKGTAGSITSSIVCPNANANTSPTITMTFTVAGLPEGFVFNKLGLHIHALSGSNAYQQNYDNVVRQWNVSAAAGDNAFASFNDIDIAAGIPGSNKLWESSQFDAVGLDGDGNLVLTLTITKGTTNGGCFFGLSEVRLMAPLVHEFSADKVYYILSRNDRETHVTEAADGKLSMSNNDLTKYQFWRLIPTNKSHCYYIQNVVTEKYIAACAENATNNTQATTGTEPVEYYIGATASTTIDAIAGCYYMASTNWPNYNNEAQGPKCLNTGGDNVVTYTAGPNTTGGYKQNSYWRFEETDEEWQRPVPPAHTEQTKVLTVYFRPCGVVSNTYLTAATIDGVDPIAYTAAAEPGSFYVPCSKDRGAVRRGSTFEVSITLNSTEDADLKANAYFDWNADGEFEATEPIALDGTAGTATVTVPDDAVSGDTRMRIRLNSNGLDYADDDVEGFVYDFPLTVVDATTERKVYVDVNGTDRGTVALSAAGDSHVVGTQLTATATPKGNATFESWREGGVVVSRDAEYTFTVEDRNMTLKAYFTPNTPVEASWDFTFNRTATSATIDAATVTVATGGVAVADVTATILPNREYLPVSNRADVLCLNKNTGGSDCATAENPNRYTLVITNNSDINYAFDYIEVSGLAVNSAGAFQPLSVDDRMRNFKVTYGNTSIGPKELYICKTNIIGGGGKVYPHGFGAKMLIPAHSTYTIEVEVYNITHDSNTLGNGCFYGLSKIALGNTAVSFGTTGYATLYAPIALTIPEGVTAYTGALDENNTWLTLTPIEGNTIPKEHAVILEGTAGNKFTLEEATEAGTDVSNNALKGQTSTVATSTVITDTQEPYTLQSDDNEEGVAFKRFEGESIAGGKAYLLLPKSLATSQQAVRIRKYKTPTEIVPSTLNAQPSTEVYDLMGRRVLNPTKGMYIVNGKKVLF